MKKLITLTLSITLMFLILSGCGHRINPTYSCRQLSYNYDDEFEPKPEKIEQTMFEEDENDLYLLDEDAAKEPISEISATIYQEDNNDAQPVDTTPEEIEQPMFEEDEDDLYLLDEDAAKEPISEISTTIYQEDNNDAQPVDTTNAYEGKITLNFLNGFLSWNELVDTCIHINSNNTTLTIEDLYCIYLIENIDKSMNSNFGYKASILVNVNSELRISLKQKLQKILDIYNSSNDLELTYVYDIFEDNFYEITAIPSNMLYEWIYGYYPYEDNKACE